MARGKKVAAGRGKSSERWLNRQRKDPYARRAAGEGNVSRAYYKLAELDRRFRLIRSDSLILELGAAPGGWTRYIESKIASNIAKGSLIVCDPRPIQASADTFVIKGEYGESWVAAKINDRLGARRVDLVLSDMAPNITGVRATDQALAMELAELAVAAADDWMKPGGNLVVKMFQGEGFEAAIADMRNKFAKIKVVKPKASRPESREVYVVGQQFLAPG